MDGLETVPSPQTRRRPRLRQCARPIDGLGERYQRVLVAGTPPYRHQHHPGGPDVDTGAVATILLGGTKLRGRVEAPNRLHRAWAGRTEQKHGVQARIGRPNNTVEQGTPRTHTRIHVVEDDTRWIKRRTLPVPVPLVVSLVPTASSRRLPSRSCTLTRALFSSPKQKGQKPNTPTHRDRQRLWRRTQRSGRRYWGSRPAIPRVLEEPINIATTLSQRHRSASTTRGQHRDPIFLLLGVWGGFWRQR